MQLLKNKLVLALFLSLSLLVSSASAALANAPEVKGSVTFADGRAMPNMVIKWVDERGSFRYTTTDSSGNFLFKSWSFDATRDELSDADGNPLKNIDTNYDGSADAYSWGYGNNVSRKGEAFNCLSNKQTFSVIPMPNMDGKFTNSSQTIAVNNNATTYVNFVFEPTKPGCPNNIQVSCNVTNKTATVSWDPYPNALRYNLMVRTYPLSNMIKTTDIYREGNWVQQEFPIQLNTNYLLSVETIKDVGGTTYASGYCSQDFLCQDETKCNNTAPTANLAARLCPADAQQSMADDGFWADFTLRTIDLKGNAFAQSDLMLSFNYSTATKPILDFLGTPTYSDPGNWFIYSLKQTTSLSGDQIYTRIDDNSRIGSKTVKEFRNFLETNKLNTVYKLKSNLRTACGDYQPFNDDIKADSTISFVSCSDAPPPPPPQTCENPAITSQVDKMAVLDQYGRLLITWSPKTVGKTYEILVYDKSNPDYTDDNTVFAIWDAPRTNLNPTPTDISYKKVVASAGSFNLPLTEELQTSNNLGIAIRDSYTTEDGKVCPAQGVEAKRAFTISGNFYNNPACVEDANLLQSLSGSSVKSGGIVGELSDTGKSYSMTIPFQSQSSIVSLELASPLYTCAESCNPSGTVCVKSDIAPPAAGTDQNVKVPFFVDADTTFADSWWNVYGGHVFAQNGMKSILPNPNNPNGDKYLIEAPIGSSDQLSAGIPIINQGAFQIGTAGFLTNRATQLQVSGAAVALTNKADYQFFKDAVGQISPNVDAETVTDPAAMATLTQDDLKIHYREGILNFTPSETWNIPAGEHQLVLVDGDLKLSAANLADTNSPSLVETPVGSTVTFAVSGTITIDGSVGNTTPSSFATNLQGIFVANKIVIADSPAGQDRRFVGEGSFYGWEGVELNRKYDDTDLNTDYPAESFIYRPDFVINYPDTLRNSSLTWREVN